MKPSNLIRRRKLTLQAYSLGALVAAATLTALLTAWSKAGQPAPPALSTARFSVAVLAGPKAAAQTAPSNAEQVAEATQPEKKANVEAVATVQKTSLPDAVVATPETAPSTATAVPVEVLPPARVSMPGGHLSAEDAPVGDLPDPFAIGPRQVFLRLFVDESGRVIRGGIVRGGGEPMRDTFIYKAMKSRTYSTKNLIRVDGGQPQWQLDLVIDYGTNDMLP